MQPVQTILPVGSIIGERYQVEDLLGRGGFGAVYLVRDLRVRQNVFALKEIADPDQRQRRHFTFEVDLLKRTDHPSLPRVYYAFDNQAQGRAYMLMDYIEGSNLEKLRRQRPGQRLPLSEVLALIGPIVEALTYLHTWQPPIIHRDVKPSNIIAPDSGERTVLVDFGIAKEFDREGTTTAIRQATPGYGAPEQYGAGTDTRTDVYGLGATVYTLLTGTSPVDAFIRLTQQMSKKSDPLPSVRQLVPEIPASVSATIARAMALDQNERFPTVEDFWQHLQVESKLEPAVAAVPAPVPLNNISVVQRPVAPGRTTSSVSPVRWVLVIGLLFLALSVGTAFALLFPGLHNQQAHAPDRTATITLATRAPTATPLPTPSPSPIPSPQPTATPVPAVPTLNSTYTGTIHDNHGDITTTMSLNGISQNGENIQGTFNVNQPLNGNGPFTGSVRSDSSIQFIVHSSDPEARAPLFFFGQLHSSGAMSGQYCSLDSSGHCNQAVGGYGTWSVQTPSGNS